MVTIRIYTKIMCLLLALVVLVACEDWLDVKPKTQIDSDNNFSTEQGYKDALTGIYLLMTDEALYGRQLSFGLVDVLGNQYTQYSTTDAYYEASLYNYEDEDTKAMIDGVWEGMYNAIANTNNLIGYLEDASASLFEGENYHVIRGEAYGLRAMMHFDLLRLYATAPAAGGTAETGIPYVNVFDTKVTTASTVAGVLTLIKEDLAVAAAELAVDPIVPGSATTDNDDYLRDRSYKLNYYAVRALQARVSLYAGETDSALAYAKEVIESGAFTFVPSYEVAVSDNSQMNRVFTEELVFTLNVGTLGTLANTWLLATTGQVLTKSDDEYKTVYEVTTGVGSSDYRYVYLTSLISGERYDTKLSQPTNIPYAFGNRMPMIRLTEMYYIAAECLKNTDAAQAVAYLNTVRQTRGMASDLVSTLTAEDIQTEIFKEYEKEMICEGQLFYYYKRLNLSSFRFSSVQADDDVYVWPLPDDEIEFGQ